MKDFLCLIKFGTPGNLFFPIKNQILAFGGLGKLLNSSLATEKPNFRQLKTGSQTTLTAKSSLNLFSNKMFEYQLSVA